jgi:predicted alpha/beta hydrolase family esterase
MSRVAFVFLAGLGNSEPHHWQRLWCGELARTNRVLWVEHADWNRVSRDRWLAEMDAALDGMGPSPAAVLVAHSLGCLLAAEWLAENWESNVASALLVAPPDLASPQAPPGISGFRNPFSLAPANCKCTVVASENDPFASMDYCQRLADHWRARLVNIGARGHINAGSELGNWAEGRKLLAEIVPAAAE